MTPQCPQVRIKELERELAAEKKKTAALLELCAGIFSDTLVNALLIEASEGVDSEC